MNRKTTLILLLLAAALGVYIGFFDRRVMGTDERESLERRAVLVNPSAIDRITVEPREGEPFGCTLRQGVWMMSSPQGARADAGRVSRLLQKVERMRRTSVVTASERAARGLGWGDYGLAPAAFRLKLSARDETLELWFGTGVGTNRFPVYLRQVGNDDILRVDDDTLAAIPSAAADLRDHRIFRSEAADAKRVELSRATGFVHLERDPAGRWRMDQPVRTRASTEAMDQLLDLLHTLRIEKYVADTDTGAAKYGFTESSPYIRVFHEGGDFPVKLTLGGTLSDDARLAYARIEGVSAIVAVSEGVRRLIQFEVDALRDRQLLGIPPERLQSIRVTGAGGEGLTLRRGDPAGWSITDPKAWPADEERIVATLGPWYSARIASFRPALEPAAALAEAGALLLEVEFTGLPHKLDDGTQAEDRQTFRLHEQRVPGGGVLVNSLPDNTWCVVLPTDVRFTSPDVLYFRDRTVLTLQANDLREVIRKQGGAESSVTRGDASQPWQGGDGAAPDGAAIQALLRALTPLRAERLVEFEPRDLGRYGLDQPRLTLTLGLAGETGISRSLLIGKLNPDGLAYAMIRGQDVVFLLPASAMPPLLAPLAQPRNADARNADAGASPSPVP